MLDRATAEPQGEAGEPRKPLGEGVPSLWLPPRSGRCGCEPRAISRTSRSWLEPVRFDYAVSAGRLAAIRLLAEVDPAFGVPSQAWILARRAEERSRHAPYTSETVIDQVLLWQVSFRLPLELFEYPRALFDLEASDRVAIALPAPGLRADTPELVDGGPRPRRRPLLRRSAVGLATGLALAAGSDSLVGVAAAASAPTHTAKNRAAARAQQEATRSAAPSSSPSTPPTVTATTTTATTTTTTATPTTTTVTTTTVTQAPAGVPVKRGRRAKKPNSSASTKTNTATAISNRGPSTTKRTTKSDSAPLTGCTLTATVVGNERASKTGRQDPPRKTEAACRAPHKTKRKSRKHAPRRPLTPTLSLSAGAALTARPLSLRQGSHKDQHGNLKRVLPSHAAAPAMPVPNSPWTAGFGIDPFTAAEIARFSTVSASLDEPPAFLIPIYKAAGRRYGIPWQILAAINAVETNYGQDLAVSPKGAIGWMQFMPGTWSEFAVHLSGDGRPNPYDPRDAIFSAARLLAADGGARDIRRALFAYNHALWYVDAVLWRAALISDRRLDAHLGRVGYALPLDAPYMAQLGRTDDGVDIEDAPDGAAVYSITPGVVTAVASDPGGFGPDYPVILVTAGPLAGQYVYYGHVAASLVMVGQHVVAGQPIAVMGHTGDAASLGHGHIEIGFSDGSGDPLNHHGGPAWTPSGAAMRSVLTALSSAFGIRTT